MEIQYTGVNWTTLNEKKIDLNLQGRQISVKQRIIRIYNLKLTVDTSRNETNIWHGYCVTWVRFIESHSIDTSDNLSPAKCHLQMNERETHRMLVFFPSNSHDTRSNVSVFLWILFTLMPFATNEVKHLSKFILLKYTKRDATYYSPTSKSVRKIT